jgi:hypothetical protein
MLVIQTNFRYMSDTVFARFRYFSTIANKCLDVAVISYTGPHIISSTLNNLYDLSILSVIYYLLLFIIIIQDNDTMNYTEEIIEEFVMCEIRENHRYTYI